MSLKMKDVACGNFRRRAQNRQKACDHEKMNLWPVFDQFKILQPRQRWMDQKKILIDFDIWNVEIGVRMQKLDQF